MFESIKSSLNCHNYTFAQKLNKLGYFLKQILPIEKAKYWVE